MRALTIASVAMVVVSIVPAAQAQAPATAGRDARPVPPRDRAFDPTAQQVPLQRLGEVSPALRPLGSVPVTSAPGTSVPLVTLDPTSLSPVPGGSWQLTLGLANNSARNLDARVMCTFRNGDRPVADVMVLMRNVPAGSRVAADVSGPPVTTFVDNVPCQMQ